MTAAELTSTPVEIPFPARRRGAIETVLRQRRTIAGLLILAVFVLVAIFAPQLEPYDPHTKSGPIYDPPSSEHLLGTDDAGIDMLSLLIEGSRVSMLVGFAATLVVTLVGGTIGLVSGYFGGRTDTILMRLTDYVLVLPDLPLMMIVAALFGRSLTNIILIIGLIYWAWTARLIRAQVKSVRERVYVKRARSLGASDRHILIHHVLPHVFPLLIANACLFIAYAIFAETFISFLGLSDPALISWGRIIAAAFTGNAMLNDAWWAIVPPGVSIAIVVLAATVVGQSLEDALNPRLRVSHLSPRRFRLRQPAPVEA